MHWNQSNYYITSSHYPYNLRNQRTKYPLALTFSCPTKRSLVRLAASIFHFSQRYHCHCDTPPSNKASATFKTRYATAAPLLHPFTGLHFGPPAAWPSSISYHTKPPLKTGHLYQKLPHHVRPQQGAQRLLLNYLKPPFLRTFASYRISYKQLLTVLIHIPRVIY